MSKKIVAIFLLLIAIIVVGIVSNRLVSDGRRDPIAGNADLYLKPEDISKLEEKSHDGDLMAARRLSLHYGFAVLDVNKQVEWLLFAAERGDVWSQFNLGMVYLYDSNVKDEAKGKSWLQKAADAGDEKSKEVLETLSKK